MLHYKTIDTKTLELLKNIQNISFFQDLYLVGGTALALQIGHRRSIDIDLFGKIKGKREDFLPELLKLGNLKTIQYSQNIHVFSIDDIKVDIVNYSYPWIGTPLKDNDIKLSSLKDIAAMKLSAITGRGTKKDFIDIYFLLNYFTLDEMIEFYNKKYQDGSIFLVMRSLIYFDDAEGDLMPTMFNYVSWTDVKKKIIKEVKKISKL